MSNQKANNGRPAAWEDDISLNNLDESPFEVGPTINDLPLAGFSIVDQFILPELLESVDVVAMGKRDTSPIPSSDDREGYFSGYDISFWLSGLSDYLKVLKTISDHQLDATSVLDFGAATGRVVRHFAAQSEIDEIWASDINRRHIRWMNSYLPKKVKPFFNHSLPTLPLEDNSLDLIVAFSVFTHIDTFETSWLAELRRVLRSGGIAYLTVHNEDTWKQVGVTGPGKSMLEGLRKSKEFDETLLGGEMPGQRLNFRFTTVGPYRTNIFHSNEYLYDVWGRFFDVLEIKPRYSFDQSVVVLRKP